MYATHPFRIYQTIKRLIEWMNAYAYKCSFSGNIYNSPTCVLAIYWIHKFHLFFKKFWVRNSLQWKMYGDILCERICAPYECVNCRYIILNVEITVCRLWPWECESDCMSANEKGMKCQWLIFLSHMHFAIASLQWSESSQRERE